MTSAPTSTRCLDGRTMRHDPQPDDPNLETDIGQCEECDGDGCERESGWSTPEQIRTAEIAREDVLIDMYRRGKIVTRLDAKEARQIIRARAKVSS